MLKEKKEKNWLLSIIKFLRDKLKELIKKIFARDLSFNQRLDKEIKELQEKLGSGELSEEEFARALERLTALQDLKLRLQMAVVGWIVTMFAEMFGVELAAAVEASTEKEDKKAEKTSLKEENKEVCENVEMKVDEREKPKVPVSLFEVSPGFVRPIPLSKPELEIVSDPLKHLLRLTELERKSHENSQKPKVEEEKKAKQEKARETEPAPKQEAPKRRIVRKANYESSGDTNVRIQENQVNYNMQEAGMNKSRCSPADHFQAPSGTTDNGKSSADQRNSASSAQPPRGLTDDVKVNNHVDSIGKTPSRG
ncbi:hypothetical protein [Wolbachia endosymbiont (group A) of Bombylius major]|uniref:hypothetical protein n=1 Tax=Wolbachia endosymbiont (group A) of Bombylius major TaxID=2953988 RepID=UPI0022327C07|nr:hypothetical protein [Wolbachia endosymbiont (group A) of Bombylius major]